MATTRTEGAMSTGAYENYRKMMYQDEDDEDAEYVPRCCCCDSMSFVRVFGILSTLYSLFSMRMRLQIAIKEALIINDFMTLMTDHMLSYLVVLIFCTISMIFIAIAFKFKLGKLLYGPILMHIVVSIINVNHMLNLFFVRWRSDTLAKMVFSNRLDDLAFDHPDRTYEELYNYLVYTIGYEASKIGFAVLFQFPFHLAFIVVCWRLRGYLEQKNAVQKLREAKLKKKVEEKTNKLLSSRIPDAPQMSH